LGNIYASILTSHRRTSYRLSSPLNYSPISKDENKQLEYIGEPPFSTESLLAECQGDCDSDLDCGLGLCCFRRSALEVVPGCSGAGAIAVDYCYKPPKGHLVITGRGPGLLNRCEGHCTKDSDCTSGLKCRQRTLFQSVPGCEGFGAYGINYCFDPRDESHFPTKSPTGYTISDFPSNLPSSRPSFIHYPSGLPSENPSVGRLQGSDYPSALPSVPPSDSPSAWPSSSFSDYPSVVPSAYPTDYPRAVPSVYPSDYPSALPSVAPSDYPSALPSVAPSDYPSAWPSSSVGDHPSVAHSAYTSNYPSAVPSVYPPTISRESGKSASSSNNQSGSELPSWVISMRRY